MKNLYLPLMALLLATTALATPSLAFLPLGRWERTASPDDDISSLAKTVTWSIVPDGTPTHWGTESNLISILDTAFGVSDSPQEAEPIDRPWFPILEAAFDRWDELGGLSLHYERHDDAAPTGISPGVMGVRGDIRLAASTIDGFGGVLAIGRLPDSGDILFDSDDADTLFAPREEYHRLKTTTMHEIGHAIGLGHVVSSDANFLMEPVSSHDVDGPQVDDIRGLHFLYGDPWESTRLSGTSLEENAVDLGLIRPGETMLLGSDPDQTTRPHDVNSISNSMEFVSISNQHDVDLYQFLPSPGILEIFVRPVGGTYQQGEPLGPQITTDATQASDLRLTLHAPGAAPRLINETIRGEPEKIRFRVDNSHAMHSIEIRGSRNNVQLYTLQLNLLPIPEPATGTLALLCLCLSLRRSNRRASPRSLL